MKNISIIISLLLFTTLVNSAEITSRVENANSQEFNIQCDNGKNITVTYRYLNDTYETAGRYFNMYRPAVAFACD